MIKQEYIEAAERSLSFKKWWGHMSVTDWDMFNYVVETYIEGDEDINSSIHKDNCFFLLFVGAAEYEN